MVFRLTGQWGPESDIAINALPVHVWCVLVCQYHGEVEIWTYMIRWELLCLFFFRCGYSFVRQLILFRFVCYLQL